MGMLGMLEKQLVSIENEGFTARNPSKTPGALLHSAEASALCDTHRARCDELLLARLHDAAIAEDGSVGAAVAGGQAIEKGAHAADSPTVVALDTGVVTACGPINVAAAGVEHVSPLLDPPEPADTVPPRIA